MKRLLIGLLFFLGTFVQAQMKLSEEAEIVVVTIGPFQGEVWSAFGHNGIRIKDAKNEIDWFYNYGIYDFNQENFFLNFAQGLLKYKLGVINYNRVHHFYKSQNRSIREQYLNLTREEKQQFFDFLQHNIKPENAEYLYNYVYDNCATKIRDLTEELYTNRIVFNFEYKKEGKTIRDLIDDHLHYQPWGNFLISIGLGQQIDIEATPKTYMFLPSYVYQAFFGATISRDSVSIPLVQKTIESYTPEKEVFTNSWITPFNVFVLLFFIIGLLTQRNLKYGQWTKWIDVTLFGLMGFIGWWVAYLWLGTEHLSKDNLNILWALPFHFPLILCINKKKLQKFFSIYFKVIAYWYVGLLLIWGMLPQPLHQALVPLVLTLVLRSFYISYFLRKKIVNGRGE